MSERKLRSKDTNSNKGSNKDVNLFDFDSMNKLIHRDQMIPVKNREGYQSIYKSTVTPVASSSASSSSSQSGSGSGPVDLPIIKDTNDVNYSKVNFHSLQTARRLHDELTDSVYDLFHRKMKKEERKMVSLDRMKVLGEVDILQTNLTLLQQHDWMKHILNITKIENPKSIKEIEYKRLLTIYEIKRLLKKYESWKKRDDNLTNDVRLYNSIHHNLGQNHGQGYLQNGTKVNQKQSHKKTSKHKKKGKYDIVEEVEYHRSPADEYNTSLEVLKRRRALERRRKYGATITLKLSNGVALVIDPILPPKFIYLNSKFYCDGEGIAFGVGLPEITRLNYSIPSYWKKRHWLPGQSNGVDSDGSQSEETD